MTNIKLEELLKQSESGNRSVILENLRFLVDQYRLLKFRPDRKLEAIGDAILDDNYGRDELKALARTLLKKQNIEDRVRIENDGSFFIKCRLCGCMDGEVKNHIEHWSEDTGDSGSIDIECPNCGAAETVFQHYEV